MAQVEFSSSGMVFGGGMVLGDEIHFGALDFIADVSTWLQEALLDAESQPI